MTATKTKTAPRNITNDRALNALEKKLRRYIERFLTKSGLPLSGEGFYFDKLQGNFESWDTGACLFGAIGWCLQSTHDAVEVKLGLTYYDSLSLEAGFCNWGRSGKLYDLGVKLRKHYCVE